VIERVGVDTAYQGQDTVGLDRPCFLSHSLNCRANVSPRDLGADAMTQSGFDMQSITPFLLSPPSEIWPCVAVEPKVEEVIDGASRGHSALGHPFRLWIMAFRHPSLNLKSFGFGSLRRNDGGISDPVSAMLPRSMHVAVIVNKKDPAAARADVEPEARDSINCVLCSLPWLREDGPDRLDVEW
jgi:hypothetical protein